MTALRWWLATAGFLAGLYASHLIYAEITRSPSLPPRLNMLVLAALIAGILFAALGSRQERQEERQEERRAADSELRARVFGDQLVALQRHFDRRMDAMTNHRVVGGLIDAATEDISGVAQQVYRELADAPPTSRARPRRRAGQRGGKPRPPVGDNASAFMSDAAEIYELGRRAGLAEHGEDEPKA